MSESLITLPTPQETERVTLRIDTSGLIQAMKCDAYHDFVSDKNLVKKHVSRAAMDRGTVMHGLLQRFYHKIWERDPPLTALNFAIGKINDLKEGMQCSDDDYKLIVLRMFDYYTKYRNDKITIATLANNTPALEVGFSIPLLDNEKYLFVLEGRMDMITIMSEQHVIWDHKAQGRKYWLYGFSLQALNYCLAGKTKRFLYNYVRLHKKVQPDTFDRKLSYVPNYLMRKWTTKLVSLFHRIAASKMEGNFIDRCFPNSSCADIGFGKICPFTNICQEPEVFMQQSQIKLGYQERKKWEPWSLDELESEENGE